tara:strand:+ start:1309 stop:2277 length:969 start_codon:yes stop_codon:yes gene_type:complete
MTSFFIDRKALKIKKLSERQHDLDLNIIKELAPVSPEKINEKHKAIARNIVNARKNGSAVIMLAGGHVIRSGVQHYLCDLMKNGFLTCLAMNGSGIIHDYEFAKIGETTESVARYIQSGQFGLWKETGEINDIINGSYQKNCTVGLGEAVGCAIEKGNFPHKNISLLASAYRMGVPVTIHVSIGQDIIHEHPNCDGAATGALSYNDFLRFSHEVENLEKGVIMNFGTAVMGPEVFLKALAMARNLAHQESRVIRDFVTLVCDLHELPDNYKTVPQKDNPAYFFRPWKTMLARTVADGGQSFYIKGKHDATIPALWTAIKNTE